MLMWDSRECGERWCDYACELLELEGGDGNESEAKGERLC